jgi:hypothetical protein
VQWLFVLPWLPVISGLANYFVSMDVHTEGYIVKRYFREIPQRKYNKIIENKMEF